MIFEIALGIGFAIPILKRVWDQADPKLTHKPLSVSYSPSEQVQLIASLLDEDDKWSFVPSKVDKRVTTYMHESGVQVYKSGSVLICDSEGKYRGAALTDADKNYLAAKRVGSIARAKDREQANLTRTLAQRLVNLADGKVDPVLGDAGVPRLPSSSEDDSVGRPDSVPAGTLTYDPVSRQVLAIGGDGTGRIVMSDELANRYGLLATRLTTDKISADAFDPGAALKRVRELNSKMSLGSLTSQELTELTRLHKRAMKEHWFA